jgi:hypothetical protein
MQYKKGCQNEIKNILYGRKKIFRRQNNEAYKYCTCLFATDEIKKKLAWKICYYLEDEEEQVRMSRWQFWATFFHFSSASHGLPLHLKKMVTFFTINRIWNMFQYQVNNLFLDHLTKKSSASQRIELLTYERVVTDSLTWLWKSWGWGCTLILFTIIPSLAFFFFQK